MIGNLNMIREEGFKVLSEQLGAAGTAVFIHQFENGIGNYTEEREEMLKEVKIDDIVERIKKRNTNKSDKQ